MSSLQQAVIGRPYLQDQHPDGLKKAASQGIGSLEIGLDLLRYISEAASPPTLKVLSEQMDMTASRLHKYLVSLQRQDFIKQISGARYILGTQSLMLGIAAMRRLDPIQLAVEALEQLHLRTDKTVSITIWNGSFPLVVRWLDSSYPLAVNVRLGSQLSSFFSASGRLFLAHLPTERQQEIIDAFYVKPLALPRHQGKPLTKQEFYNLLAELKVSNSSIFYGDFLPDINVVSSGIFDLNGQQPAVVSLMGLSGDTPVHPGSDYQQLTLQCAEAVTQRLRGKEA